MTTSTTTDPDPALAGSGQARGSDRTLTYATPESQVPAPTAEKPDRDPTLGLEVADVARALVRKADVIPGGLLSIAGLLLLGAAFVYEAEIPGRLGELEYLTAMLVGLALALLGPIVIGRNIEKARQTAKDSVERLGEMRGYQKARQELSVVGA
jgi:hypothetical protein